MAATRTIVLDIQPAPITDMIRIMMSCKNASHRLPSPSVSPPPRRRASAGALAREPGLQASSSRSPSSLRIFLPVLFRQPDSNPAPTWRIRSTRIASPKTSQWMTPSESTDRKTSASCSEHAFRTVSSHWAMCPRAAVNFLFLSNGNTNNGRPGRRGRDACRNYLHKGNRPRSRSQSTFENKIQVAHTHRGPLPRHVTVSSETPGFF